MLAHHPVACEGIDSRIVDVCGNGLGRRRFRRCRAGRRGCSSKWPVTILPRPSPGPRRSATTAVHWSPGGHRHRQSAALWRIRADGAGLAGRSPAGLPAHAGWEDAAVPPALLGDYLRDFDALMAELRLHRPALRSLRRRLCAHQDRLSAGKPGGPGCFASFWWRQQNWSPVTAAHCRGSTATAGPGANYCRRCTPPEALKLFGAVKNVFDPQNILNPGVIVDPRPLDADLRDPAPVGAGDLALAYHGDRGDFTQAVHRCTGVGKCRADNAATGGVMCPSYLATREEKDSTRGRARVLQEMVNGSAVTGGWRSPEVHEALDLCLSCKGCLSDCPTGIDMASYKAEVLHQSYRGRLRPASHYTLGRLPRWAALAARMPRAVNSVRASVESVRWRCRWPGWMPVAAFRRSPARRFGLVHVRTRRERRRRSGVAVRRLVHQLLHAGGRHRHSAGAAGRRLRTAVDRQAAVLRADLDLDWSARRGPQDPRPHRGRAVGVAAALSDIDPVPIVGMEPSCTAVLRSDAAELLDRRRRPRRREAPAHWPSCSPSAAGARPVSTGESVVAQPHCHHHAVHGVERRRATAAIGRRLGATARRMLRAGRQLRRREGSLRSVGRRRRSATAPAVAAASADTAILADGFSCRTQLADLTDRRGQHLAELLAESL